MVKSPKIRHSKQRTEPVTIDLSADDVSRSSSEAGKDGKATSADSKPKAPDTKTDAPERPEQPAAASGAAQPNKKTAGSAGETEAAAKASGFGRDPGAASSTKPEQPKSRASEKPPGGARASRTGAFAAGLAGGVIALAAAAGLYVSGYLPTPSQSSAPLPDNAAIAQLQAELDAMRDEIIALRSAPPADDGAGEAALAETNTRVDNMAVMVEDLRGEVGRLSAAVGAGGDGGAALATLGVRLDEIERRIAGMTGSGGDTEALTAEVARVTGELRTIRQSMEKNDAGQTDRIAAVEQALATLSARVDEEADKPGVALAIAASALKAAIDRGQPFAAELETFARLAPEAPEIAALRELAASGVPTAASIAAETDAAAVRMIEAARPDNVDAGLFDRLWASAESLITVRPIGAVEGEGVPAIVARMEAAIKNGDYSGAVAEYETLPAAPKAAGAEFIGKIKARQSADSLVGTVLDAALRA